MKIFLIKVLLFIPIASALSQGILKVDGKMVKDSISGKKIILRGVNLGGWLVTENWMCGIKDTTDKEGRSAYQTLEKRFNKEQVLQLVKIWQHNWITTKDIDRIKNMGMNFIRVPFGWRNLQDKNKNWIKTASGAIDFSRLDWIVNEAAKRKMYVMLDYHIWLDQEKAYNGISDVDSVKQHTYNIWKEVAKHFKGNTTVVAYDLLNEPTSSWNDHVMDNIYKTIRSVDPDHIISMEWTKPDTIRWKNIIYQDHYYGSEYRTISESLSYFNSRILPEIENYHKLNVPFYIGEFHASQNGDSKLSWLLDQFCQKDIHWSPWTYKTINMGGWSCISINPKNTQVNILIDSYEKIYEAWSQTSIETNWYELVNVKAEWTNGTFCQKFITELDANPSIPQNTCYPNPVPAGSFINTNITGYYQIKDLKGILIDEGETKSGIIELGHFKSGLYFLLANDRVCNFLKE